MRRILAFVLAAAGLVGGLGVSDAQAQVVTCPADGPGPSAWVVVNVAERTCSSGTTGSDYSINATSTYEAFYLVVRANTFRTRHGYQAQVGDLVCDGDAVPLDTFSTSHGFYRDGIRTTPFNCTLAISLPSGTAVNHQFTITNDEASEQISISTSSLNITLETTPPTATISGLAPVVGLAGDEVTVDFGERISDFSLSDLEFFNLDPVAGSLSGGTDGRYTFRVVATGDGTGRITVPAGAIEDASGNANLAGATAATTTNTAKPEFQIDNIAPFGATGRIRVELSATDLGGGFRPVSGRPDPVVTNATDVLLAYQGGGVYFLFFRPTGGEVTLSITEGELVDIQTGNPTAAFGPEVIGTYDRTAPRVVLSGLGSIVGLAPSQVTVTFTEAVSGFDLSDLTLVNLAASNLETSDSMSFTFDVVATADGSGLIRVGSDKAQDSSGNLNIASNTLIIAVDTGVPTIAITSSATALAAGETAALTFTLSEDATDFDASDVAVTGGSLSGFAGAGSNYTATFTPTAGTMGNAVISVADGAFTDAAGNANADGADADNTVTIAVDTDVPTIAITSSATALAAGETAALTFTLSEDATDFDASDVAVTGGSLSGFAGTGSIYTATFTPTPGFTGDAVIAVADAAFTDAAGNANADAADANNTVIIAVDTGVPTIAITSSATALEAGETAALTFTLSEDATDFDASDVAVTGGSLSNFTGTGSSYTAAFTPTAGTTGNAVISVADGAFTDAAGNANADGADADNTLTIAVDTDVPTVILAGTPGFPGDPYPLTITFSEPVTGFTLADITGTGATISGFTNTCGSDPCASFTAMVTADAGSEFSHSVSVAAGVAQDAAGNDNEASNVIAPPPPDGVAPVLTITGVPDGFAGPQTVTVTFDFGEDVFGFEDADITVTGGTLGAISGGRQTWTAALTLVGTEPVTVSVAAGAVQNASGEANVLTSVTGTQEMDPPSVSVSGTPTFPGDPYAIDIIFNEPVNGFVEADITGDGALISDFTRSCAIDPCASYSAVVTPASGRELSHSVGIAANVAQDVSGNFNLASPAFAPPPPDGVAPVVTISGVPEGFTGPVTATITFDWGEDVLGFEAADISVTGGTLGALTGGRQVWTAELSVIGTTDVVVSVANAAVQDASGTPSSAASVTGTFDSGSVAEEVIREFMGARGAALIAAQPGLTGLLDNAAPTGNIMVTRGVGTVQMRTGSEGPVWAALNSNWSDIDGFETSYTNLSFGTHMYLQDETLLGMMLQLDHAASAERLSEIEGMGWLIGPYYVARYGGVNVDARLLWGRTENDISPVGTYRDSFATERVLAMINLSGEIERGTATLRPLFGWSYLDDRSEAYIDALANPVAAQRVRLSQVEAALDWTMPVGAAGLEFNGGVAGLFTAETGGNGSIEGARGRIDLGLRRQGIGALDFDFGVYADGLGQPGFEAYGVDLSVDWRF